MIFERQTEQKSGLQSGQITGLISQTLEAQSLAGRTLRRVLLIPPDFTRFYSNAGFITCEYDRILRARGVQVDILPAPGTHEPMTRAQWDRMFPTIDYGRMLIHNWRTELVTLGEVPASFLSGITGGAWTDPVRCEVNRRLLDPGYDLIISMGQVLPHEVVGMSNGSKNLLVGTGGSDMINRSHMLGAMWGMERSMGRDHTPVRQMFDYCIAHFLSHLPVLYVLTVTSGGGAGLVTHGVFAGRDRRAFERAVALSQRKNILLTDRPIQTCVVLLPEDEFRTTWLGNKAIYRTRMAIADGGALVILGGGIRGFGEDAQVDRLIRTYGYAGTPSILRAFGRDRDLQENMCAAAHLIHGSAEGRFQITYAVQDEMRADIERVGYRSCAYEQAVRRYDPAKLSAGWNQTLDGEEIYFIQNPALGLWSHRTHFHKEMQESANWCNKAEYEM